MKLCVIFTIFLMLIGCVASNNGQKKTQVVIENTFGLPENMPETFYLLRGFEVTYHGFRKELARLVWSLPSR